MKTIIFSICLLLLAAICKPLCASEVTKTITHQGIMYSNDGTPVENGIYTFAFSIYNVETSGTPLWTETQDVEIVGGIYTIMLGAVEPLDIPFDTHYWLGISVNSGDELNPRIPLSSVPYAFHAQSVSNGSITSSKLADESVTQEKIHPEVSLPMSGNAGGDLTGTYPDPSITEAAVTTGKIAGSAVTSEKLANNAVTSAKIANEAVTQEKLHPAISLPISGNAGGDLSGTYPDPSISDAAVTTTKLANQAVTQDKLDPNISLPISGNAGGDLTGTYPNPKIAIGAITPDNVSFPFVAEVSTEDIPNIAPIHIINKVGSLAIKGEAPFAVQGISHHGSGSGFLGIGVYGFNSASSGTAFGVLGEASSTSGRGVFGRSLTTSGATYGVYGSSSSPSGLGVFGINVSTGGVGVAGESRGFIGVVGTATSTSGFNIGVQGASFSTGGAGVWAVAAATSGTNYGINARTQSSAGYAGYFEGRVHVTGNLSKGGGSFEIDHPVSPETMILRHSFVESPDMMNVYNGNVVTNAAGEAVIELPDYFEALNMEFRYQLTAIAQPGPDLYIAEEINNNRFKIAGGKPGMKVSWQVTGIRKDLWAEENRIVTEEYKSTELRGYYLHPEVFGQPKTHSIEWGRNPEAMKQMEETIQRLENESVN